MKNLIIISVCYLSLMIISCSPQVGSKHPPSYSEIMYISRAMSDNLFDCSYRDIGLVLQFSASDECRIFEEGNVTYLLTSAIISDSNWLWRRNISSIDPDLLNKQERFIYYQYLIIHDYYQWEGGIPIEKYNPEFYYKNWKIFFMYL